jgi:hypothetical protein
VAAAAGVLALLVLWLWPAPAPIRVVDAYLASCSENSVAPDSSLTFRDLGLVVRDYSGLEAKAERHYEFTQNIDAAKQKTENPTWRDILAQDDLPPEKRRALELLLPALPEEARPTEMMPLTIVLRPVVADLWWRRRGAGAFFEGTFRFHVLRVESPTWTSDWRIADYERVEVVQGA